MLSVSNLGAAAIAPANASFDLESALMAVQMGRVKNLDDQLQAQIEGIQASNAKSTKLNEALKLVNSMIDKFGSETDPNKTRIISDGESQALTSALSDLGMKPEDLFGAAFTQYDAHNQQAAQWNQKDLETRISKKGLDGFKTMGLMPTGYSNVSLSHFKTAAATIKGQIDTNSNTQQMDMLRLQSLTNKRNEAFETMSSVLKKITDNNSSILNRV